MTSMKQIARLLALGLVATGAAACSDPLSVENVNDPSTSQVLQTSADIESFIRNSYTTARGPLYASDGINMQLMSTGFENSAMAANFGMIERSALPRLPILNTTADQFAGDYYEVWSESSTAIRQATDGLIALARPNVTLGSAALNARARAFGKFVQAYGHASLALTYDSASVIDEAVTDAVPPLVGYGEVMQFALAKADTAIQIAAANPTIAFPVDWLGADVSAAQFIRIVSSHKARWRTQVARNAAERQAVDWNRAIAEVDSGITADFSVVDDNNRFDFWMIDYMSFRGAWQQVPYVIHGMADTSGAYQAWMGQAIDDRRPFVIQTPDTRFPQGRTLAAQRGAPGRYIRAKTNDAGAGGWVRAERGQWRWSHYSDERYAALFGQSNTGLPVPVVRVPEMQMIKAEGFIRTNRAADAVPLVNASRAAAGLPPVTVAGVPQSNACVPKLPNGQCGSLLEAVKWEKRVEQFASIYGGFYFDSRGWGDLPEGTFIHYPVPARELEVRQQQLYTYGGAGNPGSAPRGTYGY